MLSWLPQDRVANPLSVAVTVLTDECGHCPATRGGGKNYITAPSRVRNAVLGILSPYKEFSTVITFAVTSSECTALGRNRKRVTSQHIPACGLVS
ncbi:hypothetical protein PAL_GLEAN10002176 [Pteropus alecto]|uniref:Uncharacterized protein n=1 Tax=Pteropus alecto TaxID=9402 RepID=L5K7R4_PTEAL|nr:hypothetical protein PAL_GLEAN10002176 [Pteropus alecto]